MAVVRRGCLGCVKRRAGDVGRRNRNRTEKRNSREASEEIRSWPTDRMTRRPWERGGPRGGRRRTLVRAERTGGTTGAMKGGRWMPRRLAAEEGRSHAAKRSGEGLAPGDPEVSEWGNPAAVMGRHPAFAGREPGELKHLSTPRKREDSRSSGERNGRSPNQEGVRASRRCFPGVERDCGRERLIPRRELAGQPKCPGTAHRRG